MQQVRMDIRQEVILMMMVEPVAVPDADPMAEMNVCCCESAAALFSTATT
jgi:hypothetical protein